MLLRWLRGAGARPADIADMQARISDTLWSDVLRAYPFLDLPDSGQAEQLRARAAWILASKTMNEAGGLVLTDYMRLAIAAQAALPVLNLPLSLYEGWSEIIVYPGGFRVARRRQDEDGVVHEYVEDAAGEAWEGGPVVLSWEEPEPEDSGREYPEQDDLERDDLERKSRRKASNGGAGDQDDVDDADNADDTSEVDIENERNAPAHAFNVVIHEFAHKLDLEAGGDADGMPALHRHPGIRPARWRQVLEDSLERFTQALEYVEDAIPPHIDPEGPDADPWYAQLPMDPYAATDEAEFFAVSSETFFTDPEPLAQDLPEWYELLAAYYRQDPLRR